HRRLPLHRQLHPRRRDHADHGPARPAHHHRQPRRSRGAAAGAGAAGRRDGRHPDGAQRPEATRRRQRLRRALSMGVFRIVLAALVAATLAACVSMPAPTYQPSVDTSQALLVSAGSTIQVGRFTAAGNVENTSLGVRGSRLEPGSDGTYAGYLRDALVTELKAAGRHDDASGIRIDGELTDNTLNGSGARTGR